MSHDGWKLENDLCRCCHSDGSFKDLAKRCNFDTEEKVYAEMLRYTFDIHITPVVGTLCPLTYAICEPCILKLQDATSFKKQVLRCEEMFKEMYAKNIIKVAAIADLQIKDEPPDEKEDIQQDISFVDDEDFHIKDDKLERVDDVVDDEEVISKRVKHEGRKQSKKAPTKTKLQPKPKRPPKRARPRQEDEGIAKEKVIEGLTNFEDYIAIGTDPRKRYICTACNLSYGRLTDLRYHVARVHLKQKLIQCNKCPERFMYHSQRKLHMYRSHLTDRIPEMFQCEHCTRQFKRKNTLAEHMLDMHIEKKCSFCELRFVRKKYLFHMNEKHGVAMPTCGICGLRTLLKSTLTRHQRNVHLRERTKVCTVCLKRFQTESNLKDHRITHFRERVFKCDVCGKDFARMDCYRTHCRIHTGEKPFKCDLCGISYVQRASLWFHIRSRHGVQVKGKRSDIKN